MTPAEADVGSLVTCPRCGAEFDAARNLSGRQSARLDRGALKVQCGSCGSFFAASPVPDGPAKLAAARSGRPLLALAGALVAAAVVVVLVIPPRVKPPKSPGPGRGATAAPGAGPDAPTQEPMKDPVPGGATRPEPPAGPQAWSNAALELTRSIPGEFKAEFAFRIKHPVLIALEKAPQFAVEVLLDSYAEQIGLLHAALQRDFGAMFDLQSSGRVLPVVVLASREAYDRYVERDRGRALPGAVGGHYEYGRRRLVLYPGPRGDAHVLFHEGTHQVVHHFVPAERGPESFWFLEGLACYYEAFERDEKGAVVFHVVNRQRLPAAAEAFEKGESTPLEALLRLRVDDFWKQLEEPGLDAEGRTRRAQRLYAEAWALWHLLLNSGPERKRAVAGYVQAGLKGHGGVEAFEAAFGDLAALERELRGHVRRLQADEPK
jgi:hypothetical protein